MANERIHPVKDPAEETRVLVHELRVHQVELELQNDELLKTQAELELARAEYFDLYDLAPVGYCTLSSEGLILKANLAVATLLGSTRAFLVSQAFTKFIFPEDQDLFYLRKKRLIESAEPFACDLWMVTSGGASFRAHVSALTAPGPDGQPLLRLTISDLTESKKAELALSGVELAAYLRVLAAHLFRGRRPGPDVRLTLDLEPAVTAIEIAIPCGLIVNELVTNSLKHGFADGRAGEIKIVLHKADGQLRLAVSDTGVGLPKDLDQRMEKSPGLQLVSDLARQLGGVLEVGPAPAPVFTVTFPLTRPPQPGAPASGWPRG